MTRKFDGTFEGAAFEDSALNFDALIGRINPDLLKALRVILDAVIEARTSPSTQREKERQRHDRLQRERIRRAEQGVRTRRQNAKKKTRSKPTKKKAKRK